MLVSAFLLTTGLVNSLPPGSSAIAFTAATSTCSPYQATSGSAVRITTAHHASISKYGQKYAGQLDQLLSPAPGAELHLLLSKVPIRRNGLPLLDRSLFTTATTLYVLDQYVAAGCGAEAALYTVSRTTGAVNHLASSYSYRSGNTVFGTGNTVTGQRATSGTSEATGGNCDACSDSSVAVGILDVLICASTFNGLASIACGIAFVIGGNGESAICSAENCSAPTYPNFIYFSPADCNFATCTFDILAYDGAHGPVETVNDDIIWDYPPGAYASYNGFPESQQNDNFQAGAGPYYVMTIGNSAEYSWRHYASDIAWTNCTTTEETAVTLVWADGSYVYSGFTPPAAKPFMYGCPGEYP